MTIRNATTALALWALAGAALAQVSPLAAAQSRYDREIRECNGTILPAPDRDRCIREAGARLDQAKAAAGAAIPANRVSTPNPPVGQSPDGRAAIVPQSEQRPMVDQRSLSQPGLSTTRDGRATVVPQQ